jgi:hypothetical protein
MALVMAALVIIVLSLTVPWYTVRTDSTHEYFLVGDMGQVSSRVLGLVLAWASSLMAYSFFFLRSTKHRGVLFGWLAVVASVIAIAYFVSEADDAVGTLAFSGSYFVLDQHVSCGPDVGFFAAIVAAAVTCASVFVGYSTAEPEPEDRAEEPIQDTYL